MLEPGRDGPARKRDCDTTRDEPAREYPRAPRLRPPPKQKPATRASRFPLTPTARTVGRMWTILIILLLLWAGLSVLGFVIEGLFWLAIIGLILFAGTVVFGFIRNRARRQ